MRSGGEGTSNPLARGGKRLIHTYLGKVVYVHCRRWLMRGFGDLTIRPKTESIVPYIRPRTILGKLGLSAALP